jgi:hypothetical protein
VRDDRLDRRAPLPAGSAADGEDAVNQRERFLKYMRFEPVDRIPLMEMGLWPETLERWHHEGLPKWVTELRHLEDYLRLDRSFNLNWLPINHEVYPPFEPEVLEDREEDQVVRDENGIVYRQRKHHKTIPQFIRFPVTGEADYERFRQRLDGRDPGRYRDDFDEDLHWRRQRGEIVGVNFRSFFGFHRNIMGMENWCTAFYDQPRLVRRMIADRLQFAKDLFARLLATKALDFVQIWEDMSFKTAPMISPKLVRRYMLPAYRELVDYFRAGGVQLIMVDTDGRVEDLLPIFLEAGMDGTHPCEIAAGSDPLVLKEGAYVPMLDHFVPPDVSYETYLYYVERRRELLANP